MTVSASGCVHVFKKEAKVVKNKPKRNSFHFYFCTNNSTPTGNAPIKNDFNYADSEFAISTVSSIDSVSTPSQSWMKKMEWRSWIQRTKWSCPAANNLLLLA